MRKLRPVSSIQYAPLPQPAPVDFPDLTEEEMCQPKYVFARMQIRQAIEAQNKLMRRFKYIPKTDREKEIASWKN